MAKLLSTLPVGAKVKDTGTTYNGKPIVFKVLEHGHTGDPAGSTALMTESIITLKCFDAKEPNNSNSDRKNYGNNRYLHSNIKQWLNSDAAAGAWYAAQHTADQAPTTDDNCYANPYNSEKGFLANFSAEMKAALLSNTKRTAKNTVTDGGSYEDVTQKVFLLSTTEVGLANENNIAEGSIYAFFANNNTNATRIAYATQECIDAANSKSRPSSTTAAWYWWLRTPNAGNAYNARSVDTDGSLSSSNAYNGRRGVRPACTVSSSILVSDATDSDGCYTIQWNAAPNITVSSTNLGDKNAPFSFTYKVVDPDGDTTNATVKLDGATVDTKTPIDQSTTYTYTVDATALNNLSIGNHNFVIAATDSMGNTAEKTIVFNRTASTITISGTDMDKGILWELPSYSYTVSDSAGAAVTVTEYIDNTQTNQIANAQAAGTIAFDMSTFDSLSNETPHTLKIKAVNRDGAEVYRNITFTKIPDRLEFATVPDTTDAAAEQIIVILDYDKTNSPGLEVKVSNDAAAASPTWEDATQAVIDGVPYTFTNKPISGFAIAIKVKITKNANTQRVYCNALAYDFS